MIIHYLATANIPSKSANSLQIVKMCEAFSELGHNVKLYVPNLETINTKISNYYDLKYKFEIIKVGKKIKYISGLKNFIIPLFLVFKSLFNNNEKKKIFITRNLIVSLILIFFRKKHILEIHDDLSVFGKTVSYIFNKLNLINSKYIIKLIFITEALKKFISKKYFYNKKNFIVLPDATEIKYYKNFDLKKKFNIGYVGSIYQSRGIDTVINLANKDRDNNYFIYGGSSKEIEKIKFKVKSNNIILHKQVSYKKIKTVLPRMDILLLPYTKKVTVSGDYGNIYDFMSPMKMFDYLGSGKVIISSDVPVLSEVLKNKKNAIIIKNSLNVQSWFQEIKKMRFNHSRNVIVSKNAFKTSLKFRWKNRALNLLK